MLDTHMIVIGVLGSLQNSFHEVKHFNRGGYKYHIHTFLDFKEVKNEEGVRNIYLFYNIYNTIYGVEGKPYLRSEIMELVKEDLQPFIHSTKSKFIKVEEYLNKLKESSLFDKVHFYFSEAPPEDNVHIADDSWDYSTPSPRVPINSTSYHLEKL